MRPFRRSSPDARVMNPSDPTQDPPAWRLGLLVFGSLLVFPILILPRTLRVLRFAALRRRARGWTFRLLDDGVEVVRSGEPARTLRFAELAGARWMSRSIHTTASGFEVDEELVVLPNCGVVLCSSPTPSPNAAIVSDLNRALQQRGIKREPWEDVKDTSFFDLVVTVAWCGIVWLVVAAVLAWTQ